MTINMFVLKEDLNGKIVVVRFFFLSGIQMNAHNFVRSYRFMDKVIDGVKQEIDPQLKQHSLFSVPIFSVIHH